MDKGQFLLYQTPDGDSQIEVKLQNDTVWAHPINQGGLSI